MKLADLHPEWGTADGYQGTWWLSFDCQTTPGGRVYVQFHRGEPKQGIWKLLSPDQIVPGLEHLGRFPRIDVLTLQPSIGSHHCTGRGLCNGHVSIIDGEIR